MPQSSYFALSMKLATLIICLFRELDCFRGGQNDTVSKKAKITALKLEWTQHMAITYVLKSPKP
jgi:hypothetical protein